MTYKLVKQVRDEDALRESFLKLAVETFDLSFESWYQAGYWSDKYIPYCLVDGQTVIANVSVNLMDVKFAGEKKQYIQIGTVMTAKDYRQQGLAKQLLNEVLQDYQNADGVYLFANDTVRNFYPKFGFEAVTEYKTSLEVVPVTSDFKKLTMDNKENRQLLQRLYQQGNPFSKLGVTDNYGLLMFYCADFLKDCVYYSAKRQLIVVAIQNKTELECLDIFGRTDLTLQQVLNEVVSADTKLVQLGFTPPKTAQMNLNPITSDEQLFVYQAKENPFLDQEMMLPLLSHA